MNGFDANIPDELYPALARQRLQQVRRPSDLRRIEFVDGLATVMVPASALPAIAFKNDARSEGPRLRRMMRLIETRGYVPIQPIICRIGQKGKWIVVDGGHRLTALRLLRERSSGERLAGALESVGLGGGLANWLRRRLGAPEASVYFILFTGPRSYAKAATLAERASGDEAE